MQVKLAEGCRLASLEWQHKILGLAGWKLPGLIVAWLPVFAPAVAVLSPSLQTEDER